MGRATAKDRAERGHVTPDAVQGPKPFRECDFGVTDLSGSRGGGTVEG